MTVGRRLADLWVVASSQGKMEGGTVMREFIEGAVVRNGVISIKGFWFGTKGDTIGVWTVGGLKLYKMNNETRFFFDDVCSDEVLKQKTLYGYRNSMGRYLARNEFLRHVTFGRIVGLRVLSDNGIIESMDYSNSDYLEFILNKGKGSCD
jgi:hypothetical protein